MPRPYPKELRADAVAVARRGDAPISQVARDFGITESPLRNWLHAADVEDGTRHGRAAAESAELRELKRRNRLLEQENEVLRRAAAHLAQAPLPKCECASLIWPRLEWANSSERSVDPGRRHRNPRLDLQRAGPGHRPIGRPPGGLWPSTPRPRRRESPGTPRRR